MRIINLAFAFVIGSLCLTVGMWQWLFSDRAIYNRWGVAFFFCTFVGWSVASAAGACIFQRGKKTADASELPKIRFASHIHSVMVILNLLLILRVMIQLIAYPPMG